MNNKYLLAIIVPTYNSEKYINKLLTSFAGISKIRTIQFIFVDDASTDQTTHLLEKYCKNQQNGFMYKNKNNRGIAHQRNLGGKISNSKWIWYVDADDEIINIDKIINLLDLLPHIKENVISFKFITNNNGVINIPNVFKNKRLSKISTYSINNHKGVKITDWVFNKIIRKEIAMKNKYIDFWSEDLHYCSVLHFKETFKFYNEFLYSYNNNDDSVSRNPNFHKTTAISTLKLLKKNQANPLYFPDDYRNIYMINCIFMLSIRFHLINKQERNTIKTLFNNNKKNLLLKWHFSFNWKYKLLYRLMRWKCWIIVRTITNINSKKRRTIK